MSILVRFIPFATFVVLSSAADWRVGLGAGLVAEIAVIATGRPIHVGALDGGMLVFFAAMAVFAFAQPDSGLQDHITGISMAWLALVALGSLAVGRPFTLEFARQGVSADVAASPAFLRTNQVITLAWAGCFAASAIAGTVLDLADRPTLARVARILLIVAAVKFSSDYPKQVQARAQAARVPATPAHH